MLFNRLFRKPAPPVSAEAGHLMPRLKHRDFLRALKGHGVPETALPLTRPLCGDLLIAYAFDRPGEFVMATPPLLSRAGLDAGAVPDLALANLHRRVQEAGVRLIEDQGGYLLRVGEEGADSQLDAVSLLLPAIRRMLQEQIQPKGELLYCAPSRDFLFVLDSARPETHAYTRGVAEALCAGDPTHGLSPQWLHYREGQGWTLLGTEASAATPGADR